MNPFSIVVCLMGAVVLLVSPAPGRAQELEPGAYWPIPKGFNIVTAIGGLIVGGVGLYMTSHERGRGTGPTGRTPHAPS